MRKARIFCWPSVRGRTSWWVTTTFRRLASLAAAVGARCIDFHVDTPALGGLASALAGMVAVADGTDLAAQKLERVLTTEPPVLKKWIDKAES